jgi:hypothetical protein
LAYRLFKTEAEAQAQCDALNAKAKRGIRFLVEKQSGGEHWVIVKQQERKEWFFAAYVQELE